MKATEQQLEFLRDYLQKSLIYRETYDELYDHILSAIEYQKEDTSFEDAINNIIKSDFGGHQNLLKIEKATKEALVKETINTYLKYFLYYFRLPGLFYTLIIALVSYDFFAQMDFGPKVILCVFAVLVLFPGVIWFLRLYSTGYMLDTTRKSAKDKLFENLAGLPGRICLIPLFISNLSYYKMLSANNYYLITVFFVLGVFYNAALYKLYKHEFKAAKA
jgi:hypothetical protein